MTLRCKPGDLCEVISASLSNSNCIGARIVVVEARMYFDEMAWTYTTFDGQLLHGWSGNRIVYCQDSCLRPIRPAPDDEADETTADKPHEVTA